MKTRLLKTLSVVAALHIAAFTATAADYTLPFELQPSQTVFDDQCKTFDVNGDKSGNGNGAWKYQASHTAGGPNAFRYFYHDDNKADDWLMLPMVDFGTTTEVTVSFDVKTDAGVESFDVFLGNAQTIEAMTVPVLSITDTKYQEYSPLSATVRVPAGSRNEWCLGFHALSRAGEYWIDITNIRIEQATGEVTVIPGLPVIKNSSMSYLDYTATVEMPQQSVAGDALTGNMTLNVFVDDSIAETYSDMAPGASKSISLTLEPGSHTIGYQAVLNDEAGSLATETVTAEKRVITPGVPTVADGSVTGLVYSANVTMPARDTENNPITGSMSLKVAENGTVISTTADLAAGATTKIEIPLSIGSHTLAFTAVLDDVSSAAVEESVTVEEPVYDLPFTFSTTSDSFKECVVIDANGDGDDSPYSTEGKWTYSNNAFCYTNSSNDQISGDDWVILPFVNVGDAKKIKIALNAKNSNSKYPEGFELRIGSKRTVAGMTETVATYTNYNTGGEYKPVEVTVDVPATGGKKWALGIHAISEPDQFQLFINDISITAVGEDHEIPQSPVVTADNLEEKIYTATVKMPTLSVAGENLDSEMTLKVMVDDALALTKENLAPGSETEVELTLSEGTHTIAFIAAIDGNESAALTVDVTVKGEVIATGNLPYNFTVTKESFDSCIVMDVNRDGVTKNDQTFGMWSYQWLGEANGGAFKYCYSSDDQAADDWIFLPMVDFGESEGVTVSFDVMTESDAENFEVYLGQERTIDAMTLPVAKCKNYTHSGSFETMSKLVVLPESTRGGENEWCLGIHASSPANKYLFYIKNIEIKSSVITGISEIDEDKEAECEYYNLQGVRIENPSAGEIVIVRKGGKTFKKVMP